MAKILIVDDDLTITGLMEALMLMDGHQPTIVNDSTKAIEMMVAASRSIGCSLPFRPDKVLAGAPIGRSS